MDETIPAYASNDSFVIVIVSIVLAIFGIIVGFQIGSELTKNVTSKKEYLQKSAIAYGLTIVFSAAICLTGYVVLGFLTIGALGGLIAGMTMSYGKDLGPFKMAQKFAGRKLPTSEDEEEAGKKATGKEGAVQKGVEKPSGEKNENAAKKKAKKTKRNRRYNS